MEIIKYKNDRKFSLLFGVVPMVIFYILLIIKAHSHPQFLEGFLIMTIGYSFVIFGITIGHFAILNKKKGLFYKASSYFFKEKILVNDIKEIIYQSTLIVGGLGKSLYVIGTYNGTDRIIKFANVGFTEKVLAQIANDLYTANPKIKLDESAESLRKQYVAE